MGVSPVIALSRVVDLLALEGALSNRRRFTFKNANRIALL
jgi:hypothetical protein